MNGGNETNAHVLEPPVVSIAVPAEGAAFRQGSEPIVLAGTVHDSFDSPADLSVGWDVDGVLAISAEVTDEGKTTGVVDATTLGVGEHVARLQAVDTDGSTSFVHVGFKVLGPVGPPVVEITAPASAIEIAVGDAIAFQGEASDLSTPASLLEFAWSSDPDGALPGAIDLGGESSLTTTSLSEGTHLVTLAATDADGEVGEDAVTVRVVTPPSPPLVFDAFIDFETIDNARTNVWQYGHAQSAAGTFSLYTVNVEDPPGFIGWTDDENPDGLPELGVNTTARRSSSAPPTRSSFPRPSGSICTRARGFRS